MVSIFTNYVAPSVGFIVSAFGIGYGCKSRKEYQESLEKVQLGRERTASVERPHSEVGAAAERTNKQAMTSARSQIRKTYVNIFAATCNTLNSGLTLFENALKELDKNEENVDSVHDKLTKVSYGITAGANAFNCGFQLLSAGKAVFTYCTTDDPEVRQMSTLYGRHQGLLALASAGQTVGNVCSYLTNERLPSTVAAVGAGALTLIANRCYKPKIERVGNTHPDNHRVVRIYADSQIGQARDVVTRISTFGNSPQIELSSPSEPGGGLIDEERPSVPSSVDMHNPSCDIERQPIRSLIPL